MQNESGEILVPYTTADVVSETPNRRFVKNDMLKLLEGLIGMKEGYKIVIDGTEYTVSFSENALTLTSVQTGGE